MSPKDDRNLLFGVLAFKAGFIDEREFVEALSIWTHDRNRAVGDILLERGLAPDERKLADALVEKQMAKHGERGVEDRKSSRRNRRD